MDLITWRQDSQKNFNTTLFKSKTFLDDMGSNWGQSFDILNLFWNLQFKFYNFMIYNLKTSLIMFTSIHLIFNLAISRIEKWKLPMICINYMHQWLACLLQIHSYKVTPIRTRMSYICNQLVFTCSKSTMETQEQCANYV